MLTTVRAVHTFVAEHGDELEFQAGDEIQGRNPKGEEGLFPMSYISESPPTPKVASPPSPKTVSRPVSPPRSPVLAHEPVLAHVASPPAAEPLTNTSTPPSHLVPEESPKGGTIGTSDGLVETAVATVGATAAAVTNVMGRTIGEIQDAIESIAKPESEDEQELGIGQDTRAKLAEQAKLANEQREKDHRVSGGVAGLVYSDESEDDEEDHPRTLQQGAAAVDASVTAIALPDPNGHGFNGTKNGHITPEATIVKDKELEPPLLPSTPVHDSSRRITNLTGKTVSAWTVEEVVGWAQGKGFDDAELDIPQFGKRLRIAQAISELRRPTSMISSSSQQLSPHMANSVSSNMSGRGMSAPPLAFGQPFPSVTPPMSTTPTSAHEDGGNHAVWAHGRKTSSTSTKPTPIEAIREEVVLTSKPTSVPSIASAVSVPSSPVTPNSTKRESTGSVGHKKSKPSLDKQDRLSFFGRNRKPPPRQVSSSRSNPRLAFGSSTKINHLQPSSPEVITKAPTAAALQQIGKPDRSGYMKKKGERYNTWKSRYFVLKGSDLYYMKSETDRVKGHVDLTGHRVIVDENTNPGSYGFRLVGPEKTHYFSSSEQMPVREWMKALMKATIARDYSTQALGPRPPSPGAREAMQRATRRENTNTLTARDASVLVASFYPADEATHHELVQWVNSNLPPSYPRATSIPESFVSGEVVFLLVKQLAGAETPSSVTPATFAFEGGQPGIPGLFAMMDMLIDSGVDTAGVSINEVRLGDPGAISRLLESVRSWAEQRRAA
ncbi:hypothetical protein P7C73_g260, partial [Tremellales sp. Uapishka_1]